MKVLALILIFVVSVPVMAQQRGNYMFGTNFDLIKTDNDGYFEKVQAGFEFNYYLTKSITATAGAEVWTRDRASGVLGARWYPITDAYIRFRGLLGENDFAIGGGWAKPVSENLRVEAMTDYYFEGTFTIRAGVAYIVRRKSFK